MLRTSLALGILGVAALAPAQITKSGSGYLFRVRYKKGQVIRFASTNTVKGAMQGEGAMSVTLPIVLKVTDTDDKFATIRMTVGPAKAGGQVLTSAQSAVMKLDNQNKAQNSEAGSPVNAQLPEKPIRIGQSWTAMAPINTADGSVQRLDATYKFQGVKTIKGRGVAVVTYKFEGAAEGSGTMTLLMSDGTLYSNQSKMSVNAVSTKISVISKTVRK